MKHLIFAIIDDNSVAEDVLESLCNSGYNGSVIPSNSFKHTMENDGDIPMFFNLSHLEKDKLANSTTLNIVVEQESVESVMNIIREKTEKFTKCHGGMFALPIESFEGSF